MPKYLGLKTYKGRRGEHILDFGSSRGKAAFSDRVAVYVG